VGPDPNCGCCTITTFVAGGGYPGAIGGGASYCGGGAAPGPGYAGGAPGGDISGGEAYSCFSMSILFDGQIIDDARQ